MTRSSLFRRKLLQWHEEDNDRQMPWKSERDPYKIWLSEIILQQTRVTQGWSYYLKFINTFPTVRDLAAAELDVILQMWEGLGYYSRARNLHETANYISNELGGEFPSTYKELLALKGVGPYTAAAISSFAFDLPKPVVDGNSLRLVMRFQGNDTPIHTAHGKKIVLQFLEESISITHPGEFNQALMDFGATVCKPKAPLCDSCPLQTNCEAFNLGCVSRLPVKNKPKPKSHRYFHYYLVRKDQKFLLEQRRGEDIWQGLFQFPMIESADASSPGISEVGARLDIDPNFINIKFLSHQTQTLSHRYIHAYFYECAIEKCDLETVNGKWIAEPQLPDYGLPKVIREFMEKKQGTLL
jgi:A/G-specific adenine glycosylase